MSTEPQFIHPTTERLLRNLLDRIEQQGAHGTNPEPGQVYQEGLEALVAACGDCAALLFLPDADGRLTLSHSMPVAVVDGPGLTLDLADLDRSGDEPDPERVEMIAAGIADLIRGRFPERSCLVETLWEGKRLRGALALLSAAAPTLNSAARQFWERMLPALRLVFRAADLYARLLAQATIDPATGLFNQRYFGDRLSAELSRASRHGHPLSLIAFRLDAFDRIEQGLGRSVASDIVRQVASLLGPVGQAPDPHFSFRRSDVSTRQDEVSFSVILPETPKWGALTKAERLRKAIASMPSLMGPAARVTISVGVAAFPEDAADAKALGEATTAACARAHRAGMNRVEPA